MYFTKCMDTTIKRLEELSGMQILAPYYYDLDPDGFNKRLHAILAKTEYADREGDWIISVFSRGAQEPLSELPRRQIFLDRDLDNYVATKYRVKFVKCPVMMGFVSNSIDHLELFEELLLLEYDRALSIAVNDYPTVDKPVNIFLNSIIPAGFNKLDVDQQGTLTVLRWNAEIQYPILHPIEHGKVIKNINYKTVIQKINLDVEIV